MPKQMALKLDLRPDLQAVWERMPRDDRQQLARRYARVIADAARAEPDNRTKEDKR